MNFRILKKSFAIFSIFALLSLHAEETNQLNKTNKTSEQTSEDPTDALSGTKGDELLEIVQAYRKIGPSGSSKIIDELLKTPKYWTKLLQNQDTDFGYYENSKYLFISNKTIPMLWLYKIEDGNLIELKRINSIVGFGKGAKKLEGDKVTPIGVYDFVTRITKLNQYYGPVALTTNYPNAYDRSHKRTGYGIWIHGLPLDGKRNANTRGCIAIENDTLKQFDKQVDLHKTLLISYEKSIPKVEKSELASILSMLYQWKSSWKKNEIKKYLSFYTTNFIKSDGKSQGGIGLRAFSDYKARVFAKNEHKTIQFNGIDISPYPNDEGKKMFVVRFLQDYVAYQGAKISYRSKDTKELYIEMKDNKPLIAIEK
ncbi:MAG: L,D-transpeptidase family protein [Helicobacter sp.]|nr:L,D-transpeptidase family protein [Helicobacter sp.]